MGMGMDVIGWMGSRVVRDDVHMRKYVMRSSRGEDADRYDGCGG